jgi:hypothetical protein
MRLGIKRGAIRERLRCKCPTEIDEVVNIEEYIWP